MFNGYTTSLYYNTLLDFQQKTEKSEVGNYNILETKRIFGTFEVFRNAIFQH